MSDDKNTIGLTPGNRRVMEDIMDYFDEQMDAARFAMSLAIKSDEEPGQIENAETVWNVGSFDPDGEIRDLINALFPEAESPYRAVEYFINVGLQRIDDHLKENKDVDIVELV